MTRTVPISTKKEKCFVCGRKVHFRIEEGACLLREAGCENCGAGKRNSDLARAILHTCLGSQAGCLETKRAGLARLHVYNTQAFGAIDECLRFLPDYTHSEYMDGVAPGEFKDGVRCEDLTRLTFASDSFDLVISEEVLEHVQDLDAALREVRRVLKPGGLFIFTVPYNECHGTQKRTAIDDRGRVVELMPPVYHGDAVRPEGSLVFTDIGCDLTDMLAEIDMPTEDFVFSRWHKPEEVTWIADDASHAEYWKHYEKGTLFSAFRHNSHVFVSRNAKPAQRGRRVSPKKAEYARLLEVEHERVVRQFGENEELHRRIRALQREFRKASGYARALEEEFGKASNYARALEDVRGGLRKHAEGLEKQCKALEADRENAAREFKKASGYARTLEQELGKASDYARTLEEECGKLRDYARGLEEQCRALGETREELERQIEETSTYARSLERELGRQSDIPGAGPD